MDSVMKFLQGMNWVTVLAVLVAVENQIGSGSMSVTHMFPSSWVPAIQEGMGDLGSIGALMLAYGSHGKETPPVPSISPAVKAMIILAVLLGASALPQPTYAEVNLPKPRPALATSQPPIITGNGVAADLVNILNRFKVAPAPTTADEIQNTTCDFSIFAKLTLENAVPLLQKCTQMVDQGVVAPLVADMQKALDSAKAFNNGAGDGTAISCLTPALALLVAAQGTAPVKDANGVVTTPGTPPGVFTIGQKLREFVELGGPSNCKTTMQSTLNGLLAAGL